MLLKHVLLKFIDKEGITVDRITGCVPGDKIIDTWEATRENQEADWAAGEI
jgi:hypothetical protein